MQVPVRKRRFNTNKTLAVRRNWVNYCGLVFHHDYGTHTQRTSQPARAEITIPAGRGETMLARPISRLG